MASLRTKIVTWSCSAVFFAIVIIAAIRFTERMSGASGIEPVALALSAEEKEPEVKPRPMPALGDYVKITISPKEWGYHIVAAVKYDKGRYTLTFMGGSGLGSQEREWGFTPYKPGAEFKPVRLEIDNLSFRELQRAPYLPPK